jgi:hypothetical protein
MLLGPASLELSKGGNVEYRIRSDHGAKQTLPRNAVQHLQMMRAKDTVGWQSKNKGADGRRLVPSEADRGFRV